MSGREHSDDSSGNLAAGEPTVPDITVDNSRPSAPDPNDTRQDPQVARRSQRDQNVTNDPSSASRQNQSSNGTADGDTMEDPLAVRNEVWPDPLAPDDTMEDPQVAGKKVWADPLAPDETVKEAHGQERKVYPDPLALDATQPSVSSHATPRDSKSGASGGGGNTNWDPVGGAPPERPSSTQSKPAKKKTGQGFSEGDLFAQKYEIKGHIGQGGMGVVYKALDLVLGRMVAIKFLKGKSGISKMEMSRFQQEAKAIASLDHTNIIRVYEMSVTEDGDPFFVLEYLDGHALSSEIRGKKQLPLDRALSIVSQVCDALQHAHEHGVIHRDIKPSNLMIVPQKDGTDSVKLLDFGIAKLNPIDEETLLKITKTGELFGSPHYMSPEQCTGKAIAETSDIYSLGCVFYELICGVPPFSGQSALDTLDKHKNAPLPSVSESRKDLPESRLIDNLLNKMMAKEPSERYQTPVDVKAAIQEISRKLEGSPLQQFKKKIFPNGLRDARGKTSAALMLATLAAVTGSVYVVSRIPSNVNAVTPNLVPVLLKSWKTYDLKGQHLFDMGSYREAEKVFLTAVAKAKSEKPNKRLVHLYTSLQELRMVYHVLGDKNGVDRINVELLEFDAPAKDQTSKYSWDDLLKKADKISDANQLNALIDGARDLAVNGNSVSQKKNTRSMLELIRTKIEPIEGSDLAVDQLILLDADQCFKDSLPVSKDASQVISRLININPDRLAPEMARILVSVELSLPNRDLHMLEKFADYSIHQSSTAFDRINAHVYLSKIYWLTDRKTAAIDEAKICLEEAENQVPRPYYLMLSILSLRGDYDADEGNFATAIHSYIRAIAIAECCSFAKSRGAGIVDMLRVSLARAYVGIYDYNEAEKILTALVHSPNRAINAQRASWFRQLGLVYMQKKQFDKAEDALTSSVEMFKQIKSGPRFDDEWEYNAAVTDLSRAQSERKQKPATNSHHDREPD